MRVEGLLADDEGDVGKHGTIEELGQRIGIRRVDLQAIWEDEQMGVEHV